MKSLNKENSHAVALRVSKAQYEWLKKNADANYRSVSAEIRLWLDKVLPIESKTR